MELRMSQGSVRGTEGASSLVQQVEAAGLW